MKSPKFIVSTVIGLLAIALIAGLSLIALGQSSVSAASSPQAATTAVATTAAATTPTAASNGTTKKAANSQYADEFKKAFAAALGVDVSKLDSAYTGAVDQTVDQAVKDGKLTQAQGDKIKAAAKNGFKGGLGNFGKDGQTGKAGTFGQATLDAAAKALGITSDELTTDLKNGQSISDVAKAKNVDLATVKTAMLASIKSELDTAVKNGKLTQAQADKAYQAATTHIDQFLTRSFKGRAAK